ncbi:MAG: DUF4465 domain-containing protein [Candidatus Amulumruptor caecigallinarius]|nr:DUF4465 domain-containing protein [Candidatus Amulumruptor caecigallinarius]
MKKSILLLSAALIATFQASSAEQIITLDLTKSTTPLQFNAENGSWTGTYDDDAESIESQCFSFVHNAMGDYDTWWGFTASNSADNKQYANALEHQWSNMAKGGIKLADDGSVALDEYGAPVVSAEVPYIVGYYNVYMGRRPNDVVFNDGKTYEPQGVYINLNSYAYYAVEVGDSFTTPFHNDDSFTLKIHGVSPDETETELSVSLASFTNGDFTINRGWKYVDLTSLGKVNEIYFTMESTDTGAYGMNTPGYFCLDKLSVKASDSGVDAINSDSNTNIRYDRANKIIYIDGADFTMIRNIDGQTVMAGENGKFDISSLDAGVYIISAGNKTLKIAK